MTMFDPDVASKMAQLSLATELQQRLIHIDDEQSSVTHLSQGKDNLDSYQNENAIKLHLATWYRLTQIPASTSDDIKKRRFQHIMNYFIKAASQNDLENHVATNIVKACLQVSMTKQPVESLDVRERIRNHYEAIHLTSTPETQYRELIFNKYPLHNLFDALALIYTLCIDDVHHSGDDELYLLQLKFIAIAIRSMGYLPRKGVPTTVGASWQKTTTDRIRVSFAFSYVGINN